MTIWVLALILTAIACATLYYAGAGRTVNAAGAPPDATSQHFRAQLRAIESDAAIGRLGPAEATAAKAELAREVLRHKSAASPVSKGRVAIWVPLLLIVVVAIGTYASLGRPDMPAAPLASRDIAAEGQVSLKAAIETIEARLTAAPEDLRGWQVIAPAYMQLGRYADAARALRRINELSPPTPDSLTDLAEALMLQANGSLEGEPLELVRRAHDLDATHVRSLYYIAGEETRIGAFEAAVAHWNELLSLSQGNEPWLVTAQNGLAYAQAGLAPETGDAAPDEAQIDAMVDGLAGRLASQGGTIDEWTQLVRSRMVQGRMEDAQLAYDAARKAHPDAAQRTELDVLAADNGLVAR
jgi:cytochrome c-type biogenesis protein CcmH